MNKNRAEDEMSIDFLDENEEVPNENQDMQHEYEEVPDENQISTPSHIQVDEDEWKQMRSAVSTIQRERVFESTMEELRKEFPNFDQIQVIERLRDIHQKDPAKAEQLNTPMGFRMLWLELERSSVPQDPVNQGSSKGTGDDFSMHLDGAMSNKEGALRRAIDLSV